MFWAYTKSCKQDTTGIAPLLIVSYYNSSKYLVLHIMYILFQNSGMRLMIKIMYTIYNAEIYSVVELSLTALTLGYDRKNG